MWTIEEGSLHLFHSWRGAKSFRNSDKVKELCLKGRLKEALDLVKFMIQQTPNEAPIGSYVCLMKECGRRKALVEGKQVHALMVRSECGSNIFLANHLIDMYSKCGNVVDAYRVFATMPHHNVYSWTAIISAYADCGKCEEAIQLFQQMQKSAIAADKILCVVALKACSRIPCLEQGKRIHALMVERGLELNVIVKSTLVDMYTKCGCLEVARNLFNGMSIRDVVTWNAMITGYAQNGLGKKALALYEQMKREGVQPDKVTFIAVLKACASIAALGKGEEIHSLVLKENLSLDVTVQNTLIDMYAKCGCLEVAQEVFNSMIERSVVSWSVMIAGYAQNGFGNEALALYEQMKGEGVQADKVTFIVVLKACASVAALEKGKEIHSLIHKAGFGLDVNVQASLVDMYAKCGCLDVAHKLFTNLMKQSGVSSRATIAEYLQNRLGKEALVL